MSEGSVTARAITLRWPHVQLPAEQAASVSSRQLRASSRPAAQEKWTGPAPGPGGGSEHGARCPDAASSDAVRPRRHEYLPEGRCLYQWSCWQSGAAQRPMEAAQSARPLLPVLAGYIRIDVPAKLHFGGVPAVLTVPRRARLDPRPRLRGHRARPRSEPPSAGATRAQPGPHRVALERPRHHHFASSRLSRWLGSGVAHLGFSAWRWGTT